MPSNTFIETEIETCNLGKCNKTNVPSTCVVRVGAGSGWGGWLVAGPGGCSRHRGWGRNLNLSDNHCVDIHLEVYPEETAGRIGFWKPVAWTGWPLRRTAQGAVSWSPAAGRASNEGYSKVHYANQSARSLWLLCRCPNFTFTYRGVNTCLVLWLNSVLNVITNLHVELRFVWGSSGDRMEE